MPNVAEPIMLHGVDFSAAVDLKDVALVLGIHSETIRRRLRLGRFPIPPLNLGDSKIRFWGPSVIAYCSKQKAKKRQKVPA